MWNLIRRIRDVWRQVQDEFSSLFLALLVAFGVVLLSLLATGDSFSELPNRMALAGLVSFLVWAKEYVPMFSKAIKRAEKERDEAREALAKERQAFAEERRELIARIPRQPDRLEPEEKDDEGE